MPPRRYNREKRQLAVEETRRRIVQATMELHHANGILATSFEEIAKRADVATATVYRHFPTLELLVGACGALTRRAIQPPERHDAPRLFARATSLSQRVQRLVREMSSFYERSHRSWVVVLRDCQQLPMLRDVVADHHAMLETYVAEALRPVSPQPDPVVVRVICALIDYPMWQSLTDRGLKPDEINDELCRLVLSCVKRHVSKSATY